MITLSDISYRYPSADNGWTLEGVNLTVRDGEFVLICGGSGSGKSTLAYLLNGLAPHFFGGEMRGSVKVDGLDTRQESVAGLLPKVGLVLQNTDAHLFCSTVEDEIAFGLESLGVSSANIENRIRQILEMLDIQDLLHRPPQALSGGERRLVALASVLCLDPPHLVLDEPFAHLDWEGIRRVGTVLAGLHQRGKTLVVIEQRVAPLLPHASRCIVIEEGRIAFEGSPKETLSSLYEKHLLPSYPEKPRRNSQEDKRLLEIRNLCHEREGRRILQGISLDVAKGETVALVGRNGSGKTTLVRHLNGLRRPSGGSVSVMGSPVRARSPLEMASLVGISFQNPNDQFFKNRVKEELAAGLKTLGLGRERLDEICALFGLEALLDRSPYRLSEGQKRRVALASVAAMQSEILVIDEPTVGQDGRFLETIAGLLASLRDRGHTIILVTHDLEFALATAERWVVLQGGRKVAEGRPEELIRDGDLIRLGAIGGQEAWGARRKEEALAPL